jgi:hypothetical protein
VNEIKIVVTGTDKSGPALAAAEKEAKALTNAVEKIPGVTPALTGLGREADKAGEEMKGAAVDARFLGDELQKARREALELRAALAAGGDQTALDEYKKKTRELAELERAAKAVGLKGEGLLGQGEQVGAGLGQSVAKGMASSLSGAGGIGEVLLGVVTNPVGFAAALGAAALVGGEIGGVIGGAVTAGIGIGGIGAGVAASLNDPQVKAAEQGLKASFAGLAAGIGQDFAGPTTDAIHILRAEVDHLRPSIRSTLGELAPMTSVLAQGAASGMDVFWEHLSKALINSKPLIQWTADELPKVLDDVGGLLEEMSQHTDEAEFALDSFFGIIKAGIWVLEGFTKVGAVTVGAIDKVREAASKIPGVGSVFSAAHGQLDTLGDTVKDETIPVFEQLSMQLQATAVTADDLAAQMTDKVVGGLLAADHAVLSLAEAQTRLTSTLKENGRAFDIHTAAGQANREAILRSVEANLAGYDSMIKSGYSAQQAAAAYDQNTAALEDQLRKAHFTTKQIEELIGKYRKVPDHVDTEIAAHGLADAIDRLGFLLAKLNHLDGSTFGFYLHGYTEVDPIAGHHDYAQGGHWQGRAAAAGMFLPPSNPGTILAGEPQTGGEYLIPARGISRGRAAGLLSGAARGYGLDVVGGGSGGAASSAPAAGYAAIGPIEVKVNVDFSGDLDSAMATSFMRLVRERKITISAGAIVRGS